MTTQENVIETSKPQDEYTTEMTSTIAYSVVKTFKWLDYGMFALMLLVSGAIGIFFAVRERQKAVVTTKDFLLANRKMSFGPVAMSLIASFMSSVTILGVPAEYYIFGTMFTWYALSYVIVPVIVGWLFMPVFYDLGVNSAYEYLELRFSKVVRIMVTIMYLILALFYGGIVMYGPALALNQVTGFNMWGAILSTGLVCMFYTALGGLKAVIWTDVIQTIIMLGGFIAVIIQGSINLGGFGNIWRANVEGGRIDFVHFEFDPRIRHTFWSLLIGGTILWLGLNGVNQAQVQRYICCRTKREAQKAIVFNAIGLLVILVLAGMTGLTIFATYQHCDPLNSKLVNKADQLFPYIVMDTLSYLPGVPGLFVAGVYSSSLSTISSGMNAMACVTLEDFVKPYTHWRPRSYTLLSRVLIILFGVSYILVAYLASVVGGLIRMAYSLGGIISGPIVGVFTMGMLMPFTNKWGALAGIICGWGVNIWIFIGSLFYPTPVEFYNILPRYTDQCPATTTAMTSPVVNMTSSPFTTSSPENNNATTEFAASEEMNTRPAIAELYAISYIYISVMGCVVTLLVGSIVSISTGCSKHFPPGKDLLAPIFSCENNSALERSSSWVSPTPIAKAQVINYDLKPLVYDEQRPLNPPKQSNMTSRRHSFSADKESTF